MDIIAKAEETLAAIEAHVSELPFSVVVLTRSDVNLRYPAKMAVKGRTERIRKYNRELVEDRIAFAEKYLANL